METKVYDDTRAIPISQKTFLNKRNAGINQITITINFAQRRFDSPPPKIKPTTINWFQHANLIDLNIEKRIA
jgi:hypothetical protein